MRKSKFEGKVLVVMVALVALVVPTVLVALHLLHYAVANQAPDRINGYRPSFSWQRWVQPAVATAGAKTRAAVLSSAYAEAH